MSTKKRVKAQTGGQSSDEAKRRKRMQELGVSDDLPPIGGTQPLGVMSGGALDPAAQAMADIFELDPETLEFPLKGYVKDPQSKKNVAMDMFRKTYPGLVLPSDPGFVKGMVRFQRDPKTSKLTLLPREVKAKGGKVGRAKAARGGATDISLRSKPGVSSPLSTKPGATPLVPLQGQRINDIQANTGGINNLVSDLRGFQPGGGEDIASLRGFEAGGGQDISALRNFNPLTGAARSTQDELLTGGLQTNVDPLTQAAKIRAGQEFDTATSGINERLASLGLISSSAQTSAEARERAKMGERIGATGLEAGVQAAEAAAGRRSGAVGTELNASGQRLSAAGNAGQLALGQSGQQLDATQGALQGSLAQSGQRLSGLGTALGGATSAAGLELDAAQSRASGGQNLINSQMPQFGNEMAQPPAGGSTALSRLMPQGRPRTVAGAAEGGRADLGDFLSKLLYGKQFTRRAGTEGQTTSGGSQRRQLAAKDPYEELNKAFMRKQLRRQPYGGGQKFDPAKELWKIANSPATAGETFTEGVKKAGRIQALQFMGAGGQGGGRTDVASSDPFDMMKFLSSAIGGRESSSATPVSRFNQPTAGGRYAGGGDTHAALLNTRQRGAGGGVPQPELPQEMGIQTPGLMDPRRRFYDEGGGVTPGQDTGQDKIPALLRSEELVLTPELADAVIQANPLEPNPELIMSLQDLAKQPLEYSEADGEFVAAQGGQAIGRGPKADALEILTGLQNFFGTMFGPPDPQDLGEEAQLIGSGASRRAVPGFNEAFDVPSGPATPAFELPEPSSASRLPSRDDLLRRGAAATLFESQGVPSPADAGRATRDDKMGGFLPSSIDYSGPERLTKAGDAGFGQITPRAGGKGSFSAMTSTVPSAQPMSPEQLVQKRLNDATQRRDLISTVLNTDPVGGPEKQARLLTALDNADRQVSSITDEVLAREQQRLQQEETQVRGTQAQANLNESMASILRSKAQQQTAEAALAKQVLEAASIDPIIAGLLNNLETLGKIPDERTAALYETILNRRLEVQHGIQIKEHGRIRRLLGAPQFEIQTMQPEAGSGLANPQDDVGAMLAASRVPITPEMLQYFSQFYGAQ